jgi:hypothetical protein
LTTIFGGEASYMAAMAKKTIVVLVDGGGVRLAMGRNVIFL